MANRKSALTPMQKQFAETLEEQRFEMFLHVARELTGRAKQRQLQKGKGEHPSFAMSINTGIIALPS